MFGKTLPRKEWLTAAGAFGGIALTTVIAFDLMLTSGLQIDPPPSAVRYQQPSPTYTQMIDDGLRSRSSYSDVAWTEQLPIEGETTESLAGDAQGRDYREAVYEMPSEDELYREISALYATQDARAAERAEELAAIEAEREAEFAARKEAEQSYYEDGADDDYYADDFNASENEEF